MPSAPSTNVSGSWPTAAGMTLDRIRADWGAFYRVEYTEAGRYRATRPDGLVLPEADSPEGLDSAIRADYARWATR